ncbi:MAG: hypothetical protein QXS54_08970 [Candidatus Methanomethylicaceae archaeon]
MRPPPASFGGSGTRLPGWSRLNQRLCDAGISDGDEVQLSITAIWTDEIEKQEEEIKKEVLYYITAETLQKQTEIMQKHENARKARGTLTQSKITELADSCFAFVEQKRLTSACTRQASPRCARLACG